MKFIINLSDPDENNEHKVSVTPVKESSPLGCLALFFIIWVIALVAVLLTPVAG